MNSDPIRSERVTMLTDFLLALVAAGLAVPLLAGLRGGDRLLEVAWGMTFVFTAAGAITGGLFHGTRHHLSEPTTTRLWRLTLLLTAPVGFFLLAAAAVMAGSGVGRTVLFGIAVLKLVIVLVLLGRTSSFAAVAYDSGLSLLLLGGVATLSLLRRGGYPEGWWVLGGVLLSLGGAIVQQLELRSDRVFDHNDLFHLVQAAACYLFFMGAGEG